MKRLGWLACFILRGHKSADVWPGPVWLHRYADGCSRCGKVWARKSWLSTYNRN